MDIAELLKLWVTTIDGAMELNANIVANVFPKEFFLIDYQYVFDLCIYFLH